MARSRRPLAIPLVVLASGVALLSGCSVEGTVEVRPGTAVDVDVIVSHPPATSTSEGGTTWLTGGGPCTPGMEIPGLAVEQLGSASAPRCRLHGTLDSADPPRVSSDVLLVRGGGHVFARVPVSGAGRVDVTLRFPGPVVVPVAAASQEVRVVDDPTGGPGVIIVARDSWAPDATVVATALALLGGVILGAGAAAAARRIVTRVAVRRTAAEALTDDDTADEDVPSFEAGAEGPAGPPEDPTVWAPGGR